MNNANRQTLQRIYERPTRADIRWSDIESLFMALGAELKEGNGSRIRVSLKEKYAVFHRPHPRPEAKKGAVDAVRRLLIGAGIGP